MEKLWGNHPVWDIKSAIEAVRAAEPPRFVAPRMLNAPGVSQMLTPGERRPDDLTERICAAYWALRLARVPNARRQVADAVNRCGVSVGEPGSEWSGMEVAERVKQFESRVLSKWGTDRKKSRKWLVEKWREIYCAAPLVTVRIP